tara:strand:+ start:266 stop:469 length:204 start_codon:yes stop_codon:yes gene_type:complete
MFFQALVMACAVGTYNTPECNVFEDLYGPYNTVLGCEARVEEMMYVIQEVRKTPTDYFFKCVSLEGV